jgi:hypothetical protein
MNTTTCILWRTIRRVEACTTCSHTACRDDAKGTHVAQFTHRDLPRGERWFSSQPQPCHLLPMLYATCVQASEDMIGLMCSACSCANSNPRNSQPAYEEDRFPNVQFSNAMWNGERMTKHSRLRCYRGRIVVKLFLAIFFCLFPLFHLCSTHLVPLLVWYDFLMQWWASSWKGTQTNEFSHKPLERKVSQ